MGISPLVKVNLSTPVANLPGVSLRGAGNEHLLWGMELSGVSPQNMVWELQKKGAAPLVSLKVFQLQSVPVGDTNQFPPRALIPWDSGLVKPASPLQVIVRIKIPPQTPKGTFRYELQARQGKSLWRFPVTLTVWGFSLPNDLPIAILGNVGRRLGDFKRRLSGAGNLDQLVESYLREMREYRFNAVIGFYWLPVRQVVAGKPIEAFPGFTKMLDKVVNSLGFRYFRLPTFNLRGVKQGAAGRIRFLNQAPQFYKTFSQYLQKKGWEKKALVKVWDEPKPHDYSQLTRLYCAVKKAAPGLRTETAARTPEPNLAECINIWVMHGLYYNPAKVAAARQRGQEIWLYHNKLLYVDKPIANHRLIGWYLQRYDFLGFLVFNVSNWPPQGKRALPRRWETYRNGRFFSPYFYPHPGTEEPLPTLGLEAFRRGLEDYLYFEKFQQAVSAGRIPAAAARAVQERFASITVDLGNLYPPVSWQKLEEVRQQMGTLLERAEGS